eukprot:CAMPEP_0170464426 /NCGR_PEP_ID=MMETSP0123-20130129/9160_1 /TAXON_ID=182087 /ORGANISM="Favella ehrenbergii, Strain Fehren 1" /LENGTH=234 /DNA_ID=CAMNT_0010730091 /DNA_START=470 /DNA_END=1175 /DNA_ORIENTATION=+
MPHESSVCAFEERCAVDGPVQIFPHESVAVQTWEAPVRNHLDELRRFEVVGRLTRDKPMVLILGSARIDADRPDDLVDNLVVKLLSLLAVEEVLAIGVLDHEDERLILVFSQAVRVVVNDVQFVEHTVHCLHQHLLTVFVQEGLIDVALAHFPLHSLHVRRVQRHRREEEGCAGLEKGLSGEQQVKKKVAGAHVAMTKFHIEKLDSGAALKMRVTLPSGVSKLKSSRRGGTKRM